jgi:beta-glucosidase
MVHPAEGGGLFIGMKVKNAGAVAGDEVLQVYLGAPEQQPKGAGFPVHALAAFDRVHLDAGQSRAIAIQVPPRRLEFWSAADGKWIKAMGRRDVLVGGSSRDLPLKSTVTIQ